MRKYITQLQKLKETLHTTEFMFWFKKYEQTCNQIHQDYFELSFKSDCDTANEELKSKMEEYYNEIMPVLDVMNHDIQMAIPEKEVEEYSPGLAESIRIEKKSFNLKNTEELFPREMILGQQYSDLVGALSIEHEGKTLSMSASWDLIQASRPEEREAVFNKIVAARDSIREEINSIYIELISIRRQIALNAGFKNYSEYTFFTKGREWTAKQCLDFHAQIEKYLLPVQEMVQDRWLTMVPDLRPWNVSPLEDPAKIFNTNEEFLELLQKGISGMPGQVQEVHNKKIRMDLMNRLNKKVGGYCGWMPITKDNILLMNATGTDDDLFTYLHEMGHSLHHSLSGDFQISSFDHEAQTEFAEVASMSMELLGLRYFKDSGLNLKRIAREKFEGDVCFLPYMSIVDLFQHWVYTTTEDITSEVLDAKWLELSRRFGGKVDFTGYESFQASGWQRKAHIIELPFYYIEYGLSQLGAWQIYSNSRINEGDTWNHYLEALSKGGSLAIEDLYKTAGIKFPLSHPIVQEYAKEITEELKGYNS